MVEKSQWEQAAESAQADLGKLGVAAPAEIARLVAEVRQLGGGPQQEARAKLDLVITKGINDGIVGLVRASEALVRSSDENTKLMSRLASRLNLLTFGLVVFSGAQVWLALRNPPQPIHVNVPAPVVQLVPAPQPTQDAQAASRAPIVPSPDPPAAERR